MKHLPMTFVMLFFAFSAKTQQLIDVKPHDHCAEHVGYGAFLPANVNKNQDELTKKNLARLRLEFTVEKESYAKGDTVRIILYNKGSEPVELATSPAKKEIKKGCDPKDQGYFVWTAEQAEISLIRVSFYGESRWMDPGEKIEFRVHVKEQGRYKFGLLTGTETFGEDGLIVTPAFEVRR